MFSLDGNLKNKLLKTSSSWALQNVDDNAYFYGNPLSSKISSILDYTGSQLGYKANSGTYAYDSNGNTTYDPANKLTTLYNYLNLPSKFTKDNGTKQELVYDATGKKWQENEYLTDGSLLSKRSYLSSFEFEGNSLQKVFHSSGFIQNLAGNVSSGGQTNGNITGSNIVSTQKLKSGVKSEYIADKSICLLPGFESDPVFNAEIKPQSGYQWNYILKDHLGNTRVLFADKNNDGLIRQDASEALNEFLSLSNYSPFGLELGGSQQNLKQQFDYKFNGKQDNGFSGLTDFGARYLDRYLGKWTTQDPLSEKYVNISTNSFVNNNPINAFDPDGKRIILVNGYLGMGSPVGGEKYWGGSSSDFVSGAQKFFSDDQKPFFTNVNHSYLRSSTIIRKSDGYSYAKEHYSLLTEGLVKGKDNFKILTHSMGGAFGEGIMEYLKSKGWDVEALVHFNTWEPSKLGDSDKKNPNMEAPTLFFDATVINDWVQGMSEGSSSDSEGLRNADIKLRKNSHAGWRFTHRDLIDNDKFWTKYLPSALNSQGNSNQSWSETMGIIRNMIRQNSSIIINIH